ncbi:RNA 2'-phosphotransferase [Niastella koreensis]|uniref:Probable RNA 2'-phosphotransferase n=2 Tax=Niastella koreensis TaxID=354356 RepID=G8TQ92_NIAKG|nr:RNA 2'-phosphotransferase [Niastella koreensis]AEW02106.1 RNA 2'-phosphotransferase [Niastella koreensis GR20-10]OQP48794.1 RNA 2'-phosphotransferase [Niastella koreensis]
MEKQLKHISKFLSLVLRHGPEQIGLTLDEEGWADVAELIEKINKKGIRLDFPMLDTVVETNDKKRFAFNEDKTRIRASQGHTIEVDLNLPPQAPPAILYHGTAITNLPIIKEKGLVRMERQHLHLSAEEGTAKNVGGRHGKPVVLVIQALAMYEKGFVFYLSANGVWLTDHVPAEFIEF